MPRRSKPDKSQQRKRAIPKVRQYRGITRKPKKPFVAEPVRVVPRMTAREDCTLDRWD